MRSISVEKAGKDLLGLRAFKETEGGRRPLDPALVSLEESLRRVPGALLRDQLGGSPRVTISIRGAGATALDGARGVRIFVDGIPKNNAGGSAQDFINIDLSAAERLEVLLGP